MTQSNLVQYGPIFAAYGCQLDYRSADADLVVADAPKGKSAIVDAAVKDIKHYENTANYIDGVASLCVADLIDKAKNPIPKKTRNAILTALGIMVGDRYIAQALVLQKNNRSWHFSLRPNQCTHFGKACTNRGIEPDPNRKGRTSQRQPNDYHNLTSRVGADKKRSDIVGREQLVTPAFAKLFNDIPKDALTREQGLPEVTFDVKAFSKLPLDERLDIIAKLERAK